MTSIVIPAVVAGVTGAALTALLIPVLARFAPSWRLLDHPGGRKHHESTVPLVGGLGIMVAGFVAFGIVGIWWAHLEPFSWWLLLGTSMMLIMGVLDDAMKVSLRAKAIVQVIAIVPIVVPAGDVVTSLGPLFGNTDVPLGYFAIPFTILCLLGYINAVNMFDGMDGLAGGVTVIALAMLAASAWIEGLPGLVVVALAFLSSTVAFLFYNLRTPWHRRATVFLGDGGSMTLGLLVGWIAVQVAVELPGSIGSVHPMSIAWILGLPAMDTVVVMTRRIAQRRNPFKPDRLHLHYVLVDMGFSQGQATLALLALALIYGVFGLAAPVVGVPDWVMFASFVGMLVFHAVFVSLAQRRFASMRLAHQDPST